MLLLTTMAMIIAYWFYNRKKFHQLTHEIPASVVKNYLDSIIQNSTALKSSLFRGGGLDMGNGIPSVVPVGDLPSSMNIGIGSGSEEVNQKNAEIASLKLNLSDRTKQIADLEKRMQDLSASKGGGGDSDALHKEIAKLQAELNDARSSGGGNSADLAKANSELNNLRERLKEYEIIEEDLANLKRLQQENDQLKAELAALKKGGAAQPKVEAPVAAAAPPPPPVVEEEEMDLEAEMARAIAESQPAAKPAPQVAQVAAVVEVEEAPIVEGEQKSAEELLSEFEKMLG